MAFPSSPLLDDFNRASLGANWTIPWRNASGLPNPNGTQLPASGSFADGYWTTLIPTGKALEIFITVPVKGSAESCMLFATDASINGYGIEFDASTVIFFRFDAGAATSLNSPAFTYTAGDVIGMIWRTDGTLEAYKNGVLILSNAADTTYTSMDRLCLEIGSPGVNIRLDNFGGGLVGSQIPAPPPVRPLLPMLSKFFPLHSPMRGFLPPSTPVAGASLSAVSAALDFFVEALQAIVQSGATVVDEAQNLATTTSDPLESNQGVATTDAMIVEDPGGVASAGQLPLDEAQDVKQTGASGVDEVQPLSTTGLEVVESSQGVTQSGTEIVDEAQGITATGAEILDAAQGIVTTAVDPVDATQNVVGGSRAVLHFDGTSQSSTVADAAGNKVATGNAFTVAFWVKLDSFNNNILPRFWEKGSNYMALMGDSANGKYRKIAIEVQNNSGTGNANGGASEFWGSTQLNVDTWYHVAGTFDGAGAGTANIYLNGVAETISPIFAWSDVLKDTTQAFWQARRNADNLRNLRGFLRKMVVYQTALTQAQCQQIYRAASLSDMPAGYTAAWMMGEGAGTSLADGAGGTSMTTSGTWQLDGTEMFLDVPQGAATVAVVPYTALQGIVATSSDPIEELGIAAVSQTTALIIEALQGILATDAAILDATQGLVQTGASALDETQGIATTDVQVVEAGQGITATGVIPLSALQGIVQLAASALDEAMNVATTGGSPLEATQGLATLAAEVLEATQGITATGSDPIEALGNTPVAQTTALIIEALGAVAATGALVLEAVQALVSSGQLVLDETQGVALTDSLPLDATRGVAATDIQIVDETGAIANPLALPLDGAGAILTSSSTPLDSTAGVPPTTVSVPLEAAQGILKALIQQLEEPGALVVLVPLPVDSISAIPVRIQVFVGSADNLRYVGTVTGSERLLKPGAVAAGDVILLPGGVIVGESVPHPGQVTDDEAILHPGNAVATDEVH